MHVAAHGTRQQLGLHAVRIQRVVAQAGLVHQAPGQPVQQAEAAWVSMQCGVFAQRHEEGRHGDGAGGVRRAGNRCVAVWRRGGARISAQIGERVSERVYGRVGGRIGERVGEEVGLWCRGLMPVHMLRRHAFGQQGARRFAKTRHIGGVCQGDVARAGGLHGLRGR